MSEANTTEATDLQGGSTLATGVRPGPVNAGKNLPQSTPPGTGGRTSKNIELGDAGTQKADVADVGLTGQAHVGPDELAQRYRRAQALALFDTGSLRILEHLGKVNQVSISNLAGLLTSPEDWVKLGVLMRAFYAEAVGSAMRITPDGREALEKLDQLTKLLQPSQSQNQNS